MTSLAPETPFSEQHAEPSLLALKYAELIARVQDKRGPISRSDLALVLSAYEVELHLEWQHRILPDEVNTEVLGCSGEETRQ